MPKLHFSAAAHAPKLGLDITPRHLWLACLGVLARLRKAAATEIR
jgi:hypothetical protein